MTWTYVLKPCTMKLFLSESLKSFIQVSNFHLKYV